MTDSPGRSGAKFYNSSDGLFVIKTLTREEVEQMHSLLKEYHPVRILSLMCQKKLLIKNSFST